MPKPAAPQTFDFDFGFNRERPQAAVAKPVAAQVPPPRVTPTVQAAVAPVARPTSQPALPVPSPAPEPVSPTRDAIADLIAAELNSQIGSQHEERPPAPPALPPATAPAAVRVPGAVMVPPPAAQVPESRAPATPVRMPAESDTFSTAPVFGLGNRPAGQPVAPKVQLDPMDEIESLIGEAVRVELNMPSQQPVRAIEPMVARVVPAQFQPSPAVPPLGGQFAPRRTNGLRDAEPLVGGAEEAILAAAASGDTIGRVDDAFADEPGGRIEKSSRRQQKADRRQESRSRRVDDYDEEPHTGSVFKQLVVPAAAALVLVAGGLGAYWALGMNHNGGRAPILTADATPAKTIPPKPADDSVPHSVVMDELGGNAPAAPSQETLVSRDQTAGDSPSQVASQADQTTDDDGLANRKVRTVTVRPDGTIVSGDDTVAGATQLPVDRPDVPPVPGVSDANAADTAPTGMAMAAPEAPAPITDFGAAPSDSVPSAPAATDAAPDPNAPIPLPRPPRSFFAASDVGDGQPTGSVRPRSAVNALRSDGAAPNVDLIGSLASQADEAASQQSAPSAPQDQASTGSVAHVQLASQPSAAAAQSSANSLQRRFGSLFGGGKLQVVKVDLPKGTYYRVMLPTSSLPDAQQVCSSIKASGGDCVAGNG
ncbi:MAG TPA: SPOR domain-containing protein [Devosiaceae bacterium]|nr:SPOR domain-containing protein [Devosiaceae bacterium]